MCAPSLNPHLFEQNYGNPHQGTSSLLLPYILDVPKLSSGFRYQTPPKHAALCVSEIKFHAHEASNIRFHFLKFSTTDGKTTVLNGVQ